MYTTENVVEKSVRLTKNDLNIDIVDLANKAVTLEENNILTLEIKQIHSTFKIIYCYQETLKKKGKFI